MKKILLPLLLLLLVSCSVFAQDNSRVHLNTGRVIDDIKIDGIIAEKSWYMADSISSFTSVEPVEGVKPSSETIVRIVADEKNIYIAITCYEDDTQNIVAYSRARDSDLEDEDNIKIVLDTYADGRNGFIFSVNPYAARYDAIVSDNGESENDNWDAIWEARSEIQSDRWTVEIKIPVSSLTFKKGLDHWGLNVERNDQKSMEVSRWTALKRDYKMGQTFHSGLLDGLPPFSIGLGLIPTVSTIGKMTAEKGEKSIYTWENSLDIIKKITPDITAQLTVNTDFAETEVDSRQTNLTRFSLRYPEKRQFFMEGADIYDFGVGLNSDFIPFYSRRIGLASGSEVPVKWGVKVNGKIDRTYFGLLANETNSLEDVTPGSKTGVIRVKQNIMEESSVGIIGTFGDPLAIPGSWMAGADLNLKTSRFLGNKNLLVGFWGLYNNREDITGDRTAMGLVVDYPNDLFDISATYRRIGEDFSPSLGFVPRNAINYYRLSADYLPRPANKYIRKFIFESRFSLYTDLENRWESYDIFTAPVHFLLESGDRFEFNFRPAGESLKEPFEISDGVVIDSGAYHWTRYRLELETASKRKISGQATWWFGGFYGGRLDQLELEMVWRPFSLLILELNFEKSIGRLPFGDFVQDIIATRVQININSNFNVSSFIQYDNESREMGSYSRLRWTFVPGGNLFIVYKYNMINDITERFIYNSNQLIVKLSYSLRL